MVQTLGEMKLANMSECKNIKRGIRMLEWLVYLYKLLVNIIFFFPKGVATIAYGG